MSNDWSRLNAALIAPSQAASQAALASSTTAVDILWQQQSGQLALRSLQGSTAAGNATQATLFQIPQDPNWQAVGIGDVNHDQRSDILWRHRTGVMLWWVMGADQKPQQIVRLPDWADKNWQVVGTGDANGDGQLDILWRNVSDGSNLWWKMPDVTPGTTTLNWQSRQSIRSVTPSADWQANVGDFNHDGISDVFWYHRPSGIGQWWLMDQTGAIQGGLVLNPPIPTNCLVKAVVDCNGDGQLDLVMQDQAGNGYQWLLGSPSSSGKIDVLERSTFSSGLVGSGWQIVGAASSSSPVRAASFMEIDAGNSLATATLQPSGLFTKSQSIGGLNDPSDVYLFGLGQRGIFSATLSGLSADADLKLIWDKNGNQQIDSGDEITWQWERGTKNESVRKLLEAGGYYLEVSSYDGKQTNYSVQTAFQSLGSNDVDPLKFDIQISYGAGGDRVSAAARSVIESAAQFWETAIPYRSSDSLLPNGILPITIATEDLNLTDGNPDLLTLAYSGPQVVTDGTKLLLQSGNTTLNSRRLASLGTNDLRALLIHEFAHVLGFGTLWDPLDFQATNGAIVKIGTRPDRGSWIDRNSQTYRADSAAGWAYGDLRKAAGQAPSAVPTAIPLESQYLAHWSEAVFQTESLTPIAPSAGTPAPISQLTLAALKDLGWAVNFGVAAAYPLPAPGTAVANNINFANLAFNQAKSV